MSAEILEFPWRLRPRGWFGRRGAKAHLVVLVPPSAWNPRGRLRFLCGTRIRPDVTYWLHGGNRCQRCEALLRARRDDGEILERKQQHR